ncbi:Thiamine-phosphate synthase [Candidatus Nitrotoga sp. HW29]|uniref:thiamine phosphate synthase n=1 Tax=Candidatus Nitrotoga sp. HW29 TaxID=2886963 RepID=UPI001EF24D47|nr:thiamine phosphate synthase [Candidatus Nitrotoga sp. HW29]CAH1904505.1 Thiamine-phosphate synthase [Candidatus Nitrotoga sp. HW29]
MNPTYAIKGVYAITPDCTDTTDLLHRVQLALTGGIGVLQYRNKSANTTQRLEQAHALRKLTREFAIPFIVNDDAQLAVQVDADGVHLGMADGSVDTARAILGMHKIIGISCYNHLSLAQNAIHAGADYVAFGAFFPSTIKPNAVAADIELLQQARAELSVPLVAIGGITLSNAASLVHAGADALALISALFGAEDIMAIAKKLSTLFNSSRFENNKN